jgi:alcohol dehydrogenase (NADP+)
LRAAFQAGDVARSELWVTSKLWNNAHEPERVRPALEKTLTDLGLDTLDLWLMHWPVALKPDVLIPETGDDFLSLDEVPIGATWQAMEECVREGLCRHIGVSNFSAAKVEDLAEHASILPVMNQVEMHPYLPQNELLDWCIAEGVAVTAYSPLGSPDRPDSMKKADEPDLLDHPVVVDIARGIGASPAQVLIRWAIQRGTLVIPKSVNADRLAENLAAAELELGDADMQRLAGLQGPYRFVDGSFWAKPGSPYTTAWLWDE